MALFVDGPLSGLDDLRTFESSVLDVASVEGISISAKLEIAKRDIALAILRFLVGRPESPAEATPTALQHVVVTDGLKDWHTLRALAVFYRDAHHNQVNDRYLAKWKAYETEAVTASAAYFDVGVGWANRPLPRPTKLVVEVEPGPDAPNPLGLRATWAGAFGESAPSELTLFDSSQSGGRPRVRLEDAPADAIGWNIYAGPSDGELMKQNASLIPVASEWTMPEAELLSGPAPGNGQAPSQYLRRLRNTLRG